MSWYVGLQALQRLEANTSLEDIIRQVQVGHDCQAGWDV
jgi:hypothetical protein